MSKFIEQPDDLNNLSLISKEAVENFLLELNAYQGDQKLIAAIGTGGTLSMKINNGVRTPDLNLNDVLQQTGYGLNDEFELITLDAFQIDSAQMTYAHVRDIAIVMSYIAQNTTQDFLGFLIAHGTDTMAFAAATTSLMMGQGLPFSIVYTGAQKSIQEPLSDAPLNIRNAVYTLDALHAANMAEVVIVIGNRAILGTSSMKVDDTLADAFDAPLHKYVTHFEGLSYPLRLAQWLKPKRAVPFFPTLWTHDYAQTLIVHSSLGLNPDCIQTQVKDESVKAVLLFSYGAGTVDHAISDAITKQAEAKNCPVFVVSPVNTDFKVAYESGKKLLEQGVIPLTMTLPSALAKIEIALGLYEGDVQNIADFMTTNYVGEIPGEASRFSPIMGR